MNLWKVLPGLLAAALVPSVIAILITLNLKAASNEFLPLYSMMWLRVVCLKRQIKDLNNFSYRCGSTFDWPTVSCSVICSPPCLMCFGGMKLMSGEKT